MEEVEENSLLLHCLHWVATKLKFSVGLEIKSSLKFSSFKKCLLNAWYVLGIILDARDVTVKKTDKFLLLQNFTFLWI